MARRRTRVAVMVAASIIALIAADVPAHGGAQLVLRTSYRSTGARPGAEIDHPETIGVSFTTKVQLTY